MIRREHFFWLLTATVFSVLILPDLFMDGMFADGIQYSCVSKNMSRGKGTFWFPFISETWNRDGVNAFLEQPPLMYAIQAQFFRVFGTSLYVERFYTLLTALITAFLIHKIWIKFADKTYVRYSWLPVLFWILIPLTSWTFRQNMQENTMGIFTTAAIYSGLLSIFVKKRWILNASISGIFLFLASLTKGIPGLFPIVIAFAALLSTKNIKFPRAVIVSLIYLTVPTLIYVFLFLFNENANESLTFYVQSRLLTRIDSNPVVSHHYSIVLRLLTELIPAAILSILILTYAKKSGVESSADTDLKRRGMLFLLLGFAGTLPLMLTLVQRGFYMSIAFPCFGLAFALFTVPYVKGIIDRFNIRSKYFRIIQLAVLSTFLITIIITVKNAGQINRNTEILKDVYTFGEYLEPYQTISSDGPSYHNWSFQFYMIRYNDVYLEKSPRTLDFYVVLKDSLPLSPEIYQKTKLDTYKFDLYEMRAEYSKSTTKIFPN